MSSHGSSAALVGASAPPRHPLSARLRGRAWRELNGLLPKARWADRLLAWLRFVGDHRRLPRRRSPELFNDRLYALKTSDAIVDPLRVFTADKELVKHYVRSVVGERHNIPTLAVLRSLDECRAWPFPSRCVVKPTHLSGAVWLRRHGEPIDEIRLASWLRSNYYDSSREAQYRTLRPKLIVEPFVFDDDSPVDYKFFCAGGEPRMIQVDADRHVRHTRTLFDANWRPLPFAFKYPLCDTPPARPRNLGLMLDLARALSREFDFVRVDFYSDGEQALVGELTHCPENARGRFSPLEGEAAVSVLLFGR